MTDVEYGDKYAVFITKNGIKFLTNEVSLQIMDLLTHSGMTVTEISELLGQQKTSIQSNMKKLERWDFISSYIDENDKRKTVYVPSSVKILSPIVPSLDVDSIEKEIVNMVNKENEHYKGIILLMMIESMKLGIDLGPLMLRGGSILAKYAGKDFKNMNTETLLRTVERYFAEAKFPITELSFRNGDLYANIHIDRKLERSLMMTHTMILGYMMEAISLNTGVRYCLGYVKEDQDGTTHAMMTPYLGKISDGSILDDMIKEDADGGWPLSIYYVNGKSVLFGNEVQVNILQILGISQISLKGLSNSLNIPPVTIHTNMNKLVESGVIGSDAARSSKYVRYGLRGEPAIIATEKEPLLRIEMDNLFKKYANSPSQYYKALFRYVNHSFRLVGFDISNIIRHIGMNISDSIIEDEPDISAMEFLNVVCEKNMGLGFKPSVVTYVPLTIILEREGQTHSEFRFIKPFYEGLFKFGLLKLTGDDYNIRFPFTGKK